MRFIPGLHWILDGENVEVLDPRLLPLLEAVANNDSLAAAVTERGISYRAAWGLLRHYEQKLGVALVLLERGRGASLSEAGEKLVEAQATARRRLAKILPVLAVDIAATQLAGMPAVRLRVAASHDFALAALADALPTTSALELELSFMGSLQALAQFAEGRTDAAGFHVPVCGRGTFDFSPFLKALRPRTDRLLRFADREQGLIVPRGNTLGVRGFRDIAAKGLRFVNRQRGSGTRLLIDQVLADARIDPMRINGFNTEEFTHAAVAATVASGGADVGFGLRAAATEYRLTFLPLVRERYYIAVRAADAHSEPLRRLASALSGPMFQRLLRSFQGYNGESAGTMVSVDAIRGADAEDALAAD